MFAKRRYVSFDVFDTCLIRRCGRPHKIWDLMVDRLFEKDDARGRLSFTGNRCLAEEKASAKTPFPTLKNIYDEMNIAQWGFNQDDVMNLEMEIEEQELFPNPEMLKIVDEYREKGFVVVFISDMYLPTEFINIAVNCTILFLKKRRLTLNNGFILVITIVPTIEFRSQRA